MRVRSSDIIGTISAKDARALLREVRQSELDGLHIRYLRKRVGAEAVDALVAEGYLEPAKFENQLMTTVAGNALACASFGRPTSRAKAQVELDGFLERVAEIAADPGFMYEVGCVDLFGSFLDPAIDPVGDIDLAIELVARWTKDDNFNQWLNDRADAGPASLSTTDRLFWPRREVILRLKNRRAVLSFHEGGDPQEVGAPWKRIYELEGWEQRRLKGLESKG